MAHPGEHDPPRRCHHKPVSTSSQQPAGATPGQGSSGPAAGTPGAAPASPARTGTTPTSTPSPTGGHGHGKGALPGLALAAIGVVFGDIGTSPLYSLQTVFSIEHNTVRPDEADVYGVISLVFWSLVVIVSFMYVGLIMRADNQGEGGILSLAALLREKLRTSRARNVVLLLAIMGASLFYGDSVITPAISVMSAVEGLEVVNPSMSTYVIPIAVVILTGLFAMQRFGTATVGRLFGPVMVAWFVAIALVGLPHLVAHPEILKALSPTYAMTFCWSRPWVWFVAMGAVVLSITGAEALYADMGHFGVKPIRLAWFALILPALVICYLGQGAMILHDPTTVDNPFFKAAPSWATMPLVVLATAATVIASQAVISGAFSVSQQAMRLGVLPRIIVRHTSKAEGGQIYVPAINWMLFVGVLTLILVFRSSQHLASAYGLAVTGTLLLELSLFLVLVKYVWKWPTWWVAFIAIVVGGGEVTFFAGNIVKLFTGGWLPLVIAGAVVLVMTTWRRGAAFVSERRRDEEGDLQEFLAQVRDKGVPRVPGVAVYPHPNFETVPLALRHNLRFNRVLHENVIIVSLESTNVPHIRHVDRVTVDQMGEEHDGICHVQIRIGFNDNTSIPAALALVAGQHDDVLIDPDQALYFVSAMDVARGDERTSRAMPRWRTMLFLLLRRNAADAAASFKLPPDRTVVLGGRMKI